MIFAFAASLNHIVFRSFIFNASNCHKYHARAVVSVFVCSQMQGDEIFSTVLNTQQQDQWTICILKQGHHCFRQSWAPVTSFSSAVFKAVT